jgi:DNA-3-methyladenine glycosylase I
MCSSKTKATVVGIEITTTATSPVAKINGRPVLQPTCNRFPILERRNSIKKVQPKSLSTPLPPNKTSSTPPLSPKLLKSLSPRLPSTKRINETNGLNTSSEKIITPRNSTKTPTLERKKSKSFKEGSIEGSLSYSSSMITDSPGSIAGLRREQMALQNAQRKMKIAHYGRSKSAKFESVVVVVVPLDPLSNITSKTSEEEEKRCSFITPNSGTFDRKL